MEFDDGELDGSGKYCLDCGWSAPEDRTDDPSDAALDHFLETGHTIESTDRVPPDSFESL